MAGPRLASALSWCCFPAGHHQLQHPLPTAYPAVPSSPSNAPRVLAPPLEVMLYSAVFDREKTYRTGRAGDLGAGIAHKLIFSKALSTGLSRELRILRIELSALLAPYRARLGFLGFKSYKHISVRAKLYIFRHCIISPYVDTCTQVVALTRTYQ
jgi:hypothetical protein